MIPSVDSHVETRFSGIKRAGVALTVYPIGDARELGEREYPCVGIKRWIPWRFRNRDARPCLEVFTPSEAEITVQIPDIQAFMADPEHEAPLSGRLTVAADDGAREEYGNAQDRQGTPGAPA